MKNTYEPVIGLEVHVELNTKTKMFCRCNADYFGKEPNSLTCPVCLGLPGALPYINEEAINKCIQIGLALSCKINPKNHFERKNYFYPDLPKGFQISQLVLPVAVKGWIEVQDMDGKISKIRINRAHQEEDTGKLSHIGGVTLIDFNRSGVPLVEIVTEPDFTDSAQIKDYAKKLQQIFRDLGVSNADMERGDMRLEANVSVRPAGQKKLPPYRVELKNINSFRFMVAAVEFEIKRQIDALDKGENLNQETRGWDEAKKETYLQRSKEEAQDYRYFPEPDLSELTIRREGIEKLRDGIKGKLSSDKVKLWSVKYGIPTASGVTIVRQGTADFFEQTVEYGKKNGIEPKQVANYIVNQKIDLIDTSPEQIIDDIKARSIGVIRDALELEGLAKEAISENPKSVEDIKKGNQNALNVLIGAVMRKTKGKADANKTKEILVKLLKY